ncbi:protein Hook homolog 1-like [Scylla paramamosain]|uniref:protein Hook homolog 1-like n=1 Tax=Scylla paramamosain TaxID=85552 RepID=UPI003082F1ED
MTQGIHAFQSRDDVRQETSHEEGVERKREAGREGFRQLIPQIKTLLTCRPLITKFKVSGTNVKRSRCGVSSPRQVMEDHGQVWKRLEDVKDLHKQLVEAQKNKEVMTEFQQTFKGELGCLNGLQEQLTTTKEQRITTLNQKEQLEEEVWKMKGIEEEKLILVKERDKLAKHGKTLQSPQYQNTTLNKERGELQEEVKKLSESQRTERDQHLSEKSRPEEEIRTLKKSEEERSQLRGDVERLKNELKKITQIQEINNTLKS